MAAARQPQRRFEVGIMHRYACRPTAFGVKLTDSPALPRRSLLRRIARNVGDFILACAICGAFLALCAALEA